MSAETRAALLYSQMQEGLKLELMESPAVSGALDYKELCLAARNEEKKLAELEKQWWFLKQPNVAPSVTPQPATTPTNPENPYVNHGPANSPGARCCYKCSAPGHLAQDCRTPKTDSGGGRWWNCDGNRQENSPQGGGSANCITTSIQRTPGDNPDPNTTQCLLACLYSSLPSHCDGVRQVRIMNNGSCPQRVRIFLEGVPTTDVVESMADITIISKELLKQGRCSGLKVS